MTENLIQFTRMILWVFELQWNKIIGTSLSLDHWACGHKMKIHSGAAASIGLHIYSNMYILMILLCIEPCLFFADFAATSYFSWCANTWFILLYCYKYRYVWLLYVFSDREIQNSDGEMEIDRNRHVSSVPSWELTYPLLKGIFESMIFLFPKIDMWSFPAQCLPKALTDDGSCQQLFVFWHQSCDAWGSKKNMLLVIMYKEWI